MSNIKILLAEDDINLGSLLRQYLIAKKYDVDLQIDGEKAYSAFMINQYDLCIFDIMMPKKDGFTLAKDVKKINAKIPILFLTAKNLKEDVLKGFELGADDYITKPFNMDELLMRIEAILKRTGTNSNKSEETIFELGIFQFDTISQILSFQDNKIKLTTKENELLKLLSININEVLDRSEALIKVWGDDSFYNARSMDVYITKLRKHIKKDENLKIINVHGKGYKLILN